MGVSPVAAVQETVVGRSKTILATSLFGFNDETIFSLENSSGSLMVQGCLREFRDD